MNASARLVALAAILGLATACAKNGRDQQAPEEGEEGLKETLPSATLPGEEAPADEVEMPPAGLADAETMRELRASCPILVEGVELDAATTNGSVALTFRTSDSASVEDLRQRVRNLGDMYASYDGSSGLRWHEMTTRGARDLRGQRVGPMPVVSVAVVDLQEGAEIVLSPVEAAQIDVLRIHMRDHVARLQDGQCWRLDAPLPLGNIFY